MTIQAATPYLILDGKAKQAIDFYSQALQASTEALMRFGDMDPSCPEAQRDRVMHAALRFGNARIMLSDGGPDPVPSTSGSVSIALDLNDADELRRVFGALGAGGRVVQPIMDAPWGAWFGALVDRFGISWMFNCQKQPGTAA